MANSLYTQLQENEFRVLTVHAGRDNEPLICHLVKANVAEDNPHYEAISYTWGDESRRRSITVNDIDLEITASAAKALQLVRLPDDDRTVFIDYVCINQHDIPERNSQVALMSRVYRNRQVLAVLGDESDVDVARKAFAAIEEVAKEAEDAVAAQGRPLGEILFSLDGFWHMSEEPLVCSPDFDSLAALYQRRWFRRVWVIQEAILSSKCLIIWGFASIDFERVLTATAWLEHKSMVMVLEADEGRVDLSTTSGLRGIQNMWLLKRIMGYRTAYPLIQLLRQAPFGGCKDVRDQVFSLLGLYRQIALEDVTPPELLPDYHKSAAAVLRDATKFAIKQQSRLEIMEKLPAKGGERPHGLPTWVVSWFRDHIEGDARGIAYGAIACSKQSGWCHTELLPTHDPNILRVKGLLLDTLQEVLPPVASGDIIGDEMLAHMRLIEAIAASAPVSLETVGMTVMAGEWTSSAPATKQQALLWSSCVECLSHAGQDLSMPAGHILCTTDPTSYSFWVASMVASSNRCFFSTTSGLVGIGPFDVKSGDCLVVLQGGSLPFILRPVGDKHEFLGVAYVHDLMNGDAVEQHLSFEEGQQLADKEGVPRLWRGEQKPREMVFDLV